MMTIDDTAYFFKALSEPVRLRLLGLIAQQGEMCVCDLVDVLQLSQSVVSRHLAYLRNHGVLTARREGVWMHYRFEPAHPLHGLLVQAMAVQPIQQALAADVEALQGHLSEQSETRGCC